VTFPQFSKCAPEDEIRARARALIGGRITATDYDVLEALLWCLRQGNRSPSVDDLASWSFQTDRRVHPSLRRLEAAGLITVHR
jgi:hypothetical protein